MSERKKISDAKGGWQKEHFDREIQKRPERKSVFETTSRISLNPLYTPTDIPEHHYLESSGFPGAFPYTRGVYPTMYRGRPWTIRQYAGFGTAKETNERFHFLLEKGQKGLSVAFDLPTQMGYDSDDPMAKGEVGKVGVAVDSIDDMRVLFDGIPLDKISTSMTINSTAAILLALYVSIAEERGIDRRVLSGTVQNDILKEYIARGTYVFPPGPSVRLITDMFAWCAQHLPNWNPISISGYHIREAGSTAVQEVAFTLADGICYVEAGIRAGLDVDAFAPRLSFFFNAHNNLLEEVAKFRAARRLWARIMRDRFGAKDPKSLLLRFHTQTAGCTLTAQQPDNNVIRVTIQALAAVLGGTQSLHTNSLDEALGLPSDRAARIAVRTQQVVLEESGVADVMDPLGGSYMVESLTDAIEARAAAMVASIDDMGGMVKAIEAAWPQREIEKASYEYQKSIESGDQKVIGVNAYSDEREVVTEVFRLDPSIEKNQIKDLRKRKAARDESAVRTAIERLDNAASGDGDLFPPILDAVKQSVTLGEVCSTLARHFGRYREQTKVR
ncbi:MAG: methylmalonyl-CoA mutase family protein [Candidatus Latescibacterota bacterium]|nr:MAG: methylmalonyl-CoA mutase family protein [Candidatus Latescibacterota bacterium]